MSSPAGAGHGRGIRSGVVGAGRGGGGRGRGDGGGGGVRAVAGSPGPVLSVVLGDKDRSHELQEVVHYGRGMSREEAEWRAMWGRVAQWCGEQQKALLYAEYVSWVREKTTAEWEVWKNDIKSQIYEKKLWTVWNYCELFEKKENHEHFGRIVTRIFV